MQPGSDHTTDDGSTGGLDRRQLLKRAAVGGAVAWVAPQILSASAAGAATALCLPDNITWSDWEVDVDLLPSFSFQVPQATGGNVTVAFSDAGIGGGTATAAYASVVPLGAQSSSFVTLEMSATAPAEFCELTLVFDNPVQNLAFGLWDVDKGNGFWQDVVTLEASLAGSPVVLGPGGAFFLNTQIQQDPSPPNPAPQTGDQFTATVDPSGTGAGTDNSTAAANILLNYPGPIDTITIRYSAGPDEATPQPQQIGIGNFIFCSIP